MNSISTYPAKGATRCCCGQDGGIWKTWHIHGATTGKIHFHDSREQAFEVHENNIDVLKWKRSGR